MTKRQMIDEILTMNKSAKPAFLARFAETDLHEYLHHLLVIRQPRLSGDAHRYDKYFTSDRPSLMATAITPIEIPTVQETTEPVAELTFAGPEIEPTVAESQDVVQASADEPVEVVEAMEAEAAEAVAQEQHDTAAEQEAAHRVAYLPSYRMPQDGVVDADDEMDDELEIELAQADEPAAEPVSITTADVDVSADKSSEDTWLF